MKPFLVVLCMAATQLANSQNGYFSLSTGFVPYEKQGYFVGQLTAGSQLMDGILFVEYNQTVALTTLADAPSFFQIRGGQTIWINQSLFARWFVGYSVTSLPENPEKKIGHSGTTGIYIVKLLREDMHLKFEVAISNGLAVRPTVGLYTTF